MIPVCTFFLTVLICLNFSFNYLFPKMSYYLVLNSHSFYTRKMYYVLITYTFTHLHINHFISNIIFFLTCGCIVELHVANFKIMLFFYLSSMIATGIYALIYTCTNPLQISLGASGVVCALLGFYFTHIFLFWKNLSTLMEELCNMSIICLSIYLFILFIQFYMQMNKNGIINHKNHLCGFLYGSCFCFVYWLVV